MPNFALTGHLIGWRWLAVANLHLIGNTCWWWGELVHWLKGHLRSRSNQCGYTTPRHRHISSHLKLTPGHLKAAWLGGGGAGWLPRLGCLFVVSGLFVWLCIAGKWKQKKRPSDSSHCFMILFLKSVYAANSGLLCAVQELAGFVFNLEFCFFQSVFISSRLEQLQRLFSDSETNRVTCVEKRSSLFNCGWDKIISAL